MCHLGGYCWAAEAGEGPCRVPATAASSSLPRWGALATSSCQALPTLYRLSCMQPTRGGEGDWKVSWPWRFLSIGFGAQLSVQWDILELKLVENGRLSQSVLGKGKVTLPSCCRGAGMPCRSTDPVQSCSILLLPEKLPADASALQDHCTIFLHLIFAFKILQLRTI